MTRWMVEALVAGVPAEDDSLGAHWDGDVAVFTGGKRPLLVSPDSDGLYRVDTLGSTYRSSEWFELPPEPAEPLNGPTIATLLEESRVRARLRWLRSGWNNGLVVEYAEPPGLAAALPLVHDPPSRYFICKQLVELAGAESSLAIPALTALLDDPDSDVRAEAAETIANILVVEGKDRALAVAPELAETLFGALRREEEWGMAFLADAMGELEHTPAIPTLIGLLDADEFVRREAAWSLGAMRAEDAVAPLRSALEHEQEAAPANQMRAALAAITEGTASGASPRYPWDRPDGWPRTPGR